MRGRAARGSEGHEALAGLGTSALAVRAGAHAVAPQGSAAVETAEGAVWFAYTGALRCTLAPFAAAPEFGLHVDYCFDPGGETARFALLLAAEAERLLSTEAFGAALQDAVRGGLQMGSLELPPCIADDEWQVFRAGLNELVYTRFGVIVEDCVPVDLHPARDFAADLLATLGASAASSGAAVAAPAQADAPVAAPARAGDEARETGPAADARAMRRLFLELPALSSGLRALPMREGDGSFAPMQDMLRRLALAAVSVNTMPSLTLPAPGQRVTKEARGLRAAHSLAAQSALDDAWAWLASMRCGLDLERLDEADRILSNLEYSLAQRRTAGTGKMP